jgi:hypothetical protein
MVTADQVVKNPVALFQDPITAVPQDNNGVVVYLPAIPASGATSPVSGSLYFGIGTRANNGLNGATVYATSSSGNINTTYNGTTYPSYIDSGSNALFFDGLTAVPNCKISTWVYCPATPSMNLTASISAATGGVSTAVPFSIVNADQLSASVVAANIGGPTGVPAGSIVNFVFGLPFFFNKYVYTAIDGMGPPGGPIGPYFAIR